MPPDFSRAGRLARREHLYRDLNNVAREKDDYTAAALLRVPAAYPVMTSQKFCSNVVIRGALRRRATSMKNPLFFREFTDILQEQVGCQF
ncbi:MAG TPA: hypothetical protein VNR86_08930 [Sphingomicrobium sp.]|nr:hypothetical protein [Sphingomicrobium sp.]